MNGLFTGARTGLLGALRKASNYLTNFFAIHNNRVYSDGGVTTSNLQAEIMLNNDNREWILNPKFLCISPELFGYKTRTSAPYNYATKVYSANSPQSGSGNDLSQTTANSQPYLSKIAPSEKQGIKNANGDDNYMSFSTISYSSTDKWSIEAVLNWSGASASATRRSYIVGSPTSYFSLQLFNNNRFRFFSGGIGTDFTATSVQVIGKNKIIHLVANGLGGLSLYIDGALIESKTGVNTAASFNSISSNDTDLASACITSELSVVPDSLSPDRVTYRCALLKSIFPEIPTVRIAGLDVACRALDIAVTPAGNSIANVTDNTAWGALTTGAWCHHSNDLAYGSVYGKIYNGYAKAQLVTDLAASNYGYHIATEAEWNTILAAGVAGLKAMGTNYWTSSNGTNVSGLTLLGGSFRYNSGSFEPIKGTVSFWCGDSLKRVRLYDDNTYSITDSGVTNQHGFYVLLIKNY